MLRRTNRRTYGQTACQNNFFLATKSVIPFFRFLDEPNAADSSSTNSSTTEPACVQLLNHNHYLHLSKNVDDPDLPVS